MSSPSAATLHITNGDSVLYLFRKAGVTGTNLAWRDALHEGPVPGGLTLEETSGRRAMYLAQRGLGNPIKLFHDFSQRDATLRRAADFARVVLWFEHDLYDQLQLLQILFEIEKMSLDPGHVTSIQSDRYLGSMTADELVAMRSHERTLTKATADVARETWDAFTAEDPTRLAECAQHDARGLPHLRAAMLRLCEEFPSTRDGLSRSERHALQAVEQGPARIEELFERSQAREEASFLGDRMFEAILSDLRTGPSPLIEGEQILEPTALGRRVLAGDADWLEHREPDRWVGGSHIDADFAFRWNEDARAFERKA
ncbi:MAG: DUF1835 domain-containing protein [Vulcanimicrobiaceae bacterium]